jgi:hypothetical protein
MAEPCQKLRLTSVDLLQLACNVVPPLDPTLQPLFEHRCSLRRHARFGLAACCVTATVCGWSQPSVRAVAVGSRGGGPSLCGAPGAAPGGGRARLWIDAIRDGSDHDCADLTPGSNPSGSDNRHADESKCKRALPCHCEARSAVAIPVCSTAAMDCFVPRNDSLGLRGEAGPK